MPEANAREWVSVKTIKSEKSENPRACLKNAFCQMCVTICGRFDPNEGGVAGYVDRMRAKYTAKWGVQLAGMIFQTRSRVDIKIGGDCPKTRMI